MFVVGGEVLMDNTDNHGEGCPNHDASPSRYVNSKLFSDQFVCCASSYFWRKFEMYNLPKSQSEHKITKSLWLTVYF